MLLSYSRPELENWSINGTGGAFLTPAARLTNGRPSSFTRVQWLSGAQTTASVLQIRADIIETDVTPDPFGTYTGPIMTFAGLTGLTLPVGTKIICGLGQLLYDTYTVETRVIQRSDGVRCAWFAFPLSTTVLQTLRIEFAIYNDVYGFAEIAADSTFEIGELWVGPSVEWCIRPSYESDREDFSKMKETLFGQPFRTPRRAAALSQIELTPVLYPAMWGILGSNEVRIAQANLGIADIRERLLGFAPCVIVPMPNLPFTGSAIDPDYVNNNAEFGYAKSMGPVVGEAPRFVFSANFKAPPPYLPTGNQ